MKVQLGARNVLYPMPVTLVGTLVDGRPLRASPAGSQPTDTREPTAIAT
ncbi:MAG: hypothetical protein ACOYM2_13435 [Rectinemataceae bacterium]